MRAQQQCMKFWCVMIGPRCAATVHAIIVFDECSAIMLLFEECAASMHWTWVLGSMHSISNACHLCTVWWVCSCNACNFGAWWWTSKNVNNGFSYCAASEQVAKNLLISCIWEELAWNARCGSARIPMDWKWIRRSASVCVSVLYWWPLLLFSHCGWAIFCNFGCIFEINCILRKLENNTHHSYSTVHGCLGFVMKAFPQSAGRPF